jgi:hypothetical protein
MLEPHVDTYSRAVAADVVCCVIVILLRFRGSNDDVDTDEDVDAVLSTVPLLSLLLGLCSTSFIPSDCDTDTV